MASSRAMSPAFVCQTPWRASAARSRGSSGFDASSSTERAQCSFGAAQLRSRSSWGARWTDEEMSASSVLRSRCAGRSAVGIGSARAMASGRAAGSAPPPSGCTTAATPSVSRALNTSAVQPTVKSTSTRGAYRPTTWHAAHARSRTTCASSAAHAELPVLNGAVAFTSSHHSPEAATTSTIALCTPSVPCTLRSNATGSGAHLHAWIVAAAP
eukprot:7195124-Prymnesium_polylepis.1